MATSNVAAPARSRTFRHARIDAILGAAALSSLIFIWLVAVPGFGPERLPRHASHLPLLIGHVGGGTVMLLFGAGRCASA